MLHHTRHHKVNVLDQHTLDSFWVVAPIFNPWRFRSRVDLYQDFETYVKASGAKLLTIELALGERPLVLRDSKADIYIPKHSDDVMWHKERLINLAIENLPLSAKYIAWIDPDVAFSRPDWVLETIQLLQHFPIIQMFGHAANLGPNYDILNTVTGIAFAYKNGMLGDSDFKYYENFHPGFAWAARRETLDKLGQLLDIAILGSGDRHMAQALIGKVRQSYPTGITAGYEEVLEEWQVNAVAEVQGNISYLPGLLLHYWHGKKEDRKYNERWKILIDNQYDPEFDIKRDSQGLLAFAGNKPQLEQDILEYFHGRNEDSIDVK